MYQLYGHPFTRAFRVIWMLEEIGEPYELHPHAPHAPELEALNVSGKAPVLQDGDTVIADSTAIMTYLGDKHGRLSHPAGTPARAQQDSLTYLIIDEMDALLWTAMRYTLLLPEERRVPQIKDGLRWEYERNLGHLSQRMAGPFLRGDEITIPDLICIHCLNWAASSKFPAGDQKIIEYGERMRARDAYQRTSSLLKELSRKT